jgi:glycolate oxidase FAD binding subunit
LWGNTHPATAPLLELSSQTLSDSKAIDTQATNTGAAGFPVRHDATWCANHVRSIAPPVLVATPQDRSQLAEIITSAAAGDKAVAAVGAGSKISCGGIARRIDLAISTRSIDRVIDYAVSDLTITVEAGIAIKTLRDMLTQQGQMLPLDVPFAGTATLGGTLAANLNGPRRLGYGAWRDIVIGLEFVTAEGKVARAGGKVVKNVAGYDIPKLHIGAFGTLGVITEVSLKVFPLAPASATFVFGYASAEEAGRAAQSIRGSQLFPQALQLLDRGAAEIAGLSGPFACPYSVVALFAGPSVVIKRAQQDLPTLLKHSSALAEQQVRDDKEVHLWNALSELTATFLSQRSGGVAVKASLPLNQVASYCIAAESAARHADVSSAISVQAGVGIAYLYLWSQRESGSPLLMRLAEDSVSRAEQMSGRAYVEWFPPQFDGRMNPWGTLGGDFVLMRQIKEALDPKGIFNPGRFYGGI